MSGSRVACSPIEQQSLAARSPLYFLLFCSRCCVFIIALFTPYHIRSSEAFGYSPAPSRE